MLKIKEHSRAIVECIQDAENYQEAALMAYAGGFDVRFFENSVMIGINGAASVAARDTHVAISLEEEGTTGIHYPSYSELKAFFRRYS